MPSSQYAEECRSALISYQNRERRKSIWRLVALFGLLVVLGAACWLLR